MFNQSNKTNKKPITITGIEHNIILINSCLFLIKSKISFLKKVITAIKKDPICKLTSD